MQRRDLIKEIGQLNRRKATQEIKVLQSIQGVKNMLDPVYQLKKILPVQKPAPVFINELMDKTIYGAPGVITKRNRLTTNSSFFQRKYNDALEQILFKIVAQNKYKIKAVVIAVLKNLIRR